MTHRFFLNMNTIAPFLHNEPNLSTAHDTFRKAKRGSGWVRGASRRGGEAFVYARNAGESNAVWVFMVKIGLLK